MKNLHTEIEINASTEKVWETLMGFSEYPSWNPFIKKIQGEAIQGGKLEVLIEPPGGKAMTFKPAVKVCEPNVEFKWLGHLIIPGLFDGEHRFLLKKIDENTTKLVQSENFKGILVPLFWKKLEPQTIQGFEEMNQALKKRAES